MNEDIEKLQGTWNVVRLEIDGAGMAPAFFKGSRIIVAAKRFTTIAMGAEYEGRLELDPTKKPARLDLVFTTGPEKGNRSLGIYELDGDEWTICLTLGAKARPHEFATRLGSGLALETLKRATSAAPSQSKRKGRGKEAAVPRKNKLQESIPDRRGPSTELEGEWAMVSYVRDGEALEKSAVEHVKRITAGNETTVLMGGQVYMKVRFTLDGARSPKAIDYVNVHGPATGEKQKGIYELDGTMLRICVAASGQDRPGDFTTALGDGKTMTAWRRIRA